MSVNPPRKITLTYLQDSNDLYITDWSNSNQFASLVQSLFNLSSSSFFLMDSSSSIIFLIIFLLTFAFLSSESTYDLASFFAL